MIRVTIIDDESHARRTLAKLLTKYDKGVKIVGQAGSVAAGIDVIRKEHPQLVFLDIKMQDGSGFDLLDQLPVVDFHLIFITAFDHFAIRAFRYHAIDYLLKPIDPDDLTDALVKVRRYPSPHPDPEQIASLETSIRTRRLDRISLSTQQGIIILTLAEILRLESDGNYTSFHTRNQEKFVVSRSLGDFEGLLPDDRFFRIHQSHIISLDDVRIVLPRDGTTLIQMTDGAQIPVARRRRGAFLKRLEDRTL